MDKDRFRLARTGSHLGEVVRYLVLAKFLIAVFDETRNGHLDKCQVIGPQAKLDVSSSRFIFLCSSLKPSIFGAGSRWQSCKTFKAS